MDTTQTAPAKTSWISNGLKSAASGVFSDLIPRLTGEAVKIAYVSVSILLVGGFGIQMDKNCRPFWDKLFSTYLRTTTTNIALTTIGYLYDKFFPTTPSPFYVDSENNRWADVSIQKDTDGFFLISRGKRINLRATHYYCPEADRAGIRSYFNDSPSTVGFAGQMLHTIYVVNQ